MANITSISNAMYNNLSNQKPSAKIYVTKNKNKTDKTSLFKNKLDKEVDRILDVYV